jgi:hypothetical protein
VPGRLMLAIAYRWSSLFIYLTGECPVVVRIIVNESDSLFIDLVVMSKIINIYNPFLMADMEYENKVCVNVYSVEEL